MQRESGEEELVVVGTLVRKDVAIGAHARHLPQDVRISSLDRHAINDL